MNISEGKQFTQDSRAPHFPQEPGLVDDPGSRRDHPQRKSVVRVGYDGRASGRDNWDGTRVFSVVGDLEEVDVGGAV